MEKPRNQTDISHDSKDLAGILQKSPKWVIDFRARSS